MGLQVYSAHLSHPLCALKILYLGQCVILGSVSRTAGVGVTYQLFAVAICHSEHNIFATLTLGLQVLALPFIVSSWLTAFCHHTLVLSTRQHL